MDDVHKKVVVVVEDVDAARTALRWALHNIIRSGDVLTLLHVFTRSRNRKKLRVLRLQGYQLALSFRELCNSFTNVSVEIVVAEGDQDGVGIASMVREMGAYTVVVGLHDQSFLYRLLLTHNNMSAMFNCRVLAIRPPPPSSPARKKKMNVITTNAAPPSSSSPAPSMDFSQIDLATLQVPEIQPQKIPYRVCPDPSAIIWRSRKSRRRRRSLWTLNLPPSPSCLHTMLIPHRMSLVPLPHKPKVTLLQSISQVESSSSVDNRLPCPRYRRRLRLLVESLQLESQSLVSKFIQRGNFLPGMITPKTPTNSRIFSNGSELLM